jgi:tetratricopeptide (TPR) repeat protein
MHHTASHQSNGRRLVALVGGLIGICLAFSCCSPEAKEARYLESGKRMMQKKDYARAIIQFSNAVKVKPNDAEPRYQLALAYLATHDLNSCASNLQMALKLNPTHQQARLQMAELMAVFGNRESVQKAQATIHDLIKTEPASADELSALAITEFKLGNPQDAENHLEEALKKSPKDLAAAISLAKVKRSLHDLAGAEDTLKKAAAQPPPSANAYVALGQFYMSVGRATDAETQFRRAMQTDPKNGLGLLSLAALQVRTNKLDQAEQTYAQLSALPDKQYRGYHATFLSARGKHDQAIAEFEKLFREQPDDRGARTDLVREYMRAQRTDEALKLLTAVLDKHPKDFDALLQRSGIYLASGRADDAQKDLTQALRFRADSPEAHYLMAKVNQMHGSGLNERQELGEALRLRPDFLAARVLLCQSLIASGSAQAALDVMDAPKVQRNNLAYLVSRNWALLALNRTTEARTEVDRGLAAVKAPELLLQDAYLKIGQKDYASARASLAEALTKSPEDLRILRLIVASYAAQKQTAEAVRTIQEYASQHPKSAPLQQFLAQVLIANGRLAEARTALLAAKAANSKFTPADLSLAQMDVSAGRPNDAIKTLSAVLVQDPNNIAARLLLADLEDARGDRVPAMDAYKKILDLQPSNILALNNLAFDLAEYGNKPDEALGYAQKAAELAPDAAAVADTLGWVLYHKGLYSVALQHLEKAAEKEPTARHKCHLAMAYLKMGDQVRGQKNLETALKLDPNIPEIRTAQEILEAMPNGR